MSNDRPSNESAIALRMYLTVGAMDPRFRAACKGTLDELDRLSAEVAELRRDAERYRWLKDNHLQTGADSWIRTGEDLEEAIDAALGEQP